MLNFNVDNKNILNEINYRATHKLAMNLFCLNLHSKNIVIKIMVLLYMP